jgi:2-amino-4-hydroxy-6-hydroxymethyldihydropteridine diphosphokinase
LSVTAKDKVVQEEHLIYLSLGSNIAPIKNLPRAVAMLRHYGEIIAVSSVWDTPPYGTSGPRFLNASVAITTSFSPTQFKNLALRRIEIKMGRVRTFDKNAPRPIDLDIVIADGWIADSNIWDRAHLAVPLGELLPGLAHPTRGMTLAQIAQNFLLNADIRPCPEITL